VRILLSNDDGIDAPGLALLAAAARLVTSDVWIVAPRRKWTAASHQLSFDTTLELSCVRDRVYSCSGAPADCIVAAMTILLPAPERPGLVLTGVNDDSNLGEDAVYSGTLAAAREATFWGIPAAGISRPRASTQGVHDARCLAALFEVLWERRREWAADGHFLSINLPRLLPAPVVEASVGRDKIGGTTEVLSRNKDGSVSFRLRRGRPGTRIAGDEGSAIDAGCIAVARRSWHGTAPLNGDLIARLSSRVRRA
jgi:5'-nucleotidase